MIEEYFLQKRGNPVLLNPKEWTLIREWFEAEIPEEVVLRGIDRAMEKREEDDKASLSLRYCKRIVKSEYKRYLKSLEGKQPSEAKATPDAANVREFLTRLVSSLEQSSTSARESANAALADLLTQQKNVLQGQILNAFDPNSPLDLQRVEHQLTVLETEIEDVLFQTVSEERMKLLKEDAMHDLKSFQDKVELPVYQEMMRRALIKALRKLYSIPRLSLFYM